MRRTTQSTASRGAPGRPHLRQRRRPTAMQAVGRCGLLVRNSLLGAVSLMRSDRQDDSTAAVGLAHQPPRRRPRSNRSALVPRASCEARTTASPPEGLRLRPPRSGTGAKDETRRPQTGSLRGLQGAREDDAQQPSGSARVMVITVLRDSRATPGQITQNGRRRITLRARMLRPCSGKPIRAQCS
jgi:hypothetical protein